MIKYEVYTLIERTDVFVFYQNIITNGRLDYIGIYSNAHYPFSRVQMLTFVRLLADVSTADEICKELNITVAFHNNLCESCLVKHPHALLSF